MSGWTPPAARAWMFVALGVTLGLVGSGCEPTDRSTSGTVTVAVAANFLEAHETLAERFTARTGFAVVTSAGSTGQLFAQVMNGAPFDVFLAADSARPRRLEAEGRSVPDHRVAYALGRLALYGPTLDSVRDGGADLASEGVRNIAIANPRTAPYGAAALAVIEALGVPGVGDRVVQGESIGQAFQFVESGSAELGFVALSQVLDAPDRAYWIVPSRYHAPIVQDAVLLGRAETSAAARAYFRFLGSNEARDVIESFGYATPEPGGPP